MATVYYADNYSRPIESNPGVGVSITREFRYTIAAAFVINDTIKLSRIPVGVVLTDFFVDVPDLDTSTGLRLQLGDNTTAGKYVTGEATVGVGPGKLTPAVQGVAAALPFHYTALNDLVITISTAASGTAAASGVFRGWMRYHYFGQTPLLG